MATYGPHSLGSTGAPVEVSAEAHPPRPAAGITVDWATVTAAVAASTLSDRTPVAIGDKVLPFGTVLTKITASGKYGPYASGATDGRQTLARGDVVIVNMTVKETSPLGLAATDHPDVITGGLVWKSRVKMGSAGQPTQAALEAVMPLLRYVEGS